MTEMSAKRGGKVKKDWRGARTYRLRTQTIERVDAQTKRLECWQSDLVDLLLERALGELESGNWELQKRPIAYELSW